MNSLDKFLGFICDKCPFCRHARKHPGSPVGKLFSGHGEKCRAWEAQSQLYAGKKGSFQDETK